MDAVAWVTLAASIVGLVYYAGRAAARLDALEDWRNEVKTDLKDIKRDVGSIAARFVAHP